MRHFCTHFIYSALPLINTDFLVLPCIRKCVSPLQISLAGTRHNLETYPMQVSGHIQSSVAPAIVDATLANIDTSTTTEKPAVTPVVTASPAVHVEAPMSAPTAAPLESTVAAETGAEIQKDRLDFIMIKYIVRGDNPRKYFDPKELAELTESVRVQGINQPILVRPLENGRFKIIAGERRYRAALAAHGDEYEMPVMIRDCSESQARILANIENTQRADMAATEEALSAAVIVGEVKGDRDEAARLLSWSRSKLDSRLALMNCSESVREALNERTIKLGHAELFASLSKESQDKILPALIERSLTVVDLKALIEKAAAKLSAAIFDKADCAACPHNSSVQRTMFNESVTDGSCTNNACYKTKTEAALDATKESLKDEYPVIRIVRAGDNFAQVKLRADGPTGVGEAQAEACRGCADFGAAVSALPERMGLVFKEQCFNTACNQEKVAARIRSEKNAKEAVANAATDASGTKDALKGATEAKGKEKPPAEAKTTVSEGDKVKAYREEVWRKAMKKEIAGSYELSVQYLIALAVTGNIRHVNQTGMTKVFEKLTGASKASDLQKVADQTQQMSPDQMDNAMRMLAVSAMDELPVHELTRLTKHIKLDLTKHWKMDPTFLALFTKSEIEIIAKSVKLDKALGDGFKKLFSEKKEVLIEKLLGVKTFDYSAAIPPVLMYK
jgi:PRTRC genetic system ParB family protein